MATLVIDPQLELVGRFTLAIGESLASAVLPLAFRLLPGKPRPKIEVPHLQSGRQWTV
jgi:hypothetical protein